VGYGEGIKCCEAEECSSSASGYQEGGADDEALGTTERSGVPGAVGGRPSEVSGVAEAPEKCGNKEERRGAVQVSLTCMSRSPATQLGSETLMSARRDRLEVR